MYKRITGDFIDYSEIGVVENMRTGTLAAAMCTLKAYEDSGLSPREVQALLQRSNGASLPEQKACLHSGVRVDNGKKVVGYYVRLEDSSKKKVSHRIYPGYAEAERDGNEYAFYPDFYEVDPDSLRIVVDEN